MRHGLSNLCVLLLLCAGAGGAEPWTVSRRHPVPFDAPPLLSASVHASTAELTARTWLRFYQEWISVVSRSPCRMDPSCSRYSLLAIQKHGAAIGIVMTADRLLHEADEQKIARVVRTAGQAFCLDPVSNNDFWWHPK